MNLKNSKNTKFDYFVGAVTLIGASIAILAYYKHAQTRKLKDRLLKIENEIAEIELDRKLNGES